MCTLIIQAGDMGPMTIKRPAMSEGPLPINEDIAVSVVNDCLALIRRENPSVVIFRLIFTAQEAFKIDLFYSLRGEEEISPMGHVEFEYRTLLKLRGSMQADFSGLEFPM